MLRVSAPVLYGRRYLAPVVASYLSRNPKMRVALSLADRRVNFVEEAVDVAIRVGPLDDSTTRRSPRGHAGKTRLALGLIGPCASPSTSTTR